MTKRANAAPALVDPPSEDSPAADRPSQLPLVLLVAALLMPVLVAGIGMATNGSDSVPVGEVRSTGGSIVTTDVTDTVATEGLVGLEEEGQALGYLAEDLLAVRFGVAVEGTDPERVAAIESAAGTEVGIVRVFARWDTAFPAERHRILLDEGRIIHLSVRPRTEAGDIIAWAEVANAAPGSTTHDELLGWVDAVADYGEQIYFTFNHEPETTQSAGSGTPDEFVAAWRRTVDLLRAAGGDDVQTVLVLGRGSYETGAIDRWYPGDDVVDVVGVDPYNWYHCQGTDRPWTDPAQLIGAALQFAIDRNKPLAIPEIASTEDPADPERKATWMRQLAATLGSPGVAEHLAFVAWFDIHDSAWPACDWSIESTPASKEAFGELLESLGSIR
ncbi:MAG: hypothetical protein ACR2QO_06395 [Acidimicrobiales bacterium]